MSATIAERLAAADQENELRKARLILQHNMLSELPPHLHCPTISNESTHAFFGLPGAWLSFSRSHVPYDKRDTYNAVAILKALEDAGFIAMPITLCHWDNYRRSPWPGAQEEIPETKGNYKLTDSEAIAPLYLDPNQYTGTEAECFYRSPKGYILKVTVETSAPCRIAARRMEINGGWYYERGSARLDFPQHWHDLQANGETIANVCVHSKAYVDTEQGISGNLYFTPLTEQTEFPLKPSELLALLEARP